MAMSCFLQSVLARNVKTTPATFLKRHLDFVVVFFDKIIFLSVFRNIYFTIPRSVCCLHERVPDKQEENSVEVEIGHPVNDFANEKAAC